MYKYTTYNEQRIGTYLLIEVHQLRADLPRTSQP
jgi:hypothetical protein